MYVEENFDNEKQVNLKPIWNPKYFLLLSILFTHIPVMIFYILNFHRLREKSLRNKAIIIMIGATLIVVIGVMFIPDGTIGAAVGGGISIGLGFYMSSSQKELYKKHIDKGGKSAKYYFPVVVCILYISVLIWIMILTIQVPDQYVQFLDDEVYYTENVLYEDVDALGNFLIEIQYFSLENPRVSAKLDYVNGVYKVYFITLSEAADDQEVINAFRSIRDMIKEYVFRENEVEVYLTDEYFKTHTAID